MPPAAMRRSRKIQRPKKISAGSDPGEQRGEEVLVAAAAELDAVLLELLRERGVDPGGDEAVRLARRRLLDRAGDPALGDRQLVDLALLEKLPELAVGQIFGLARLLKDRLHDRIASTAIITYQALKLLFLSMWDSPAPPGTGV